MCTLLWFQRDLRVKHNRALTWSLSQGKPIIAVYIHSPEEEAPWAPGAASSWWLHHSLVALAKDLLEYNIKLQFFNGDSAKIIPRLANDYQADAVAWTSRHEPQRTKYETSIRQKLLDSKKNVRCFRDDVLINPNTFFTQKGTPYRVFTPFYKRLRQEIQLPSTPRIKRLPKGIQHSDYVAHGQAVDLPQLNLISAHSWHQKLARHCTPGEANAQQKLDIFITNKLENYQLWRDHPAMDVGSNLSAHLHFGEITMQQIINTLLPIIEFENTPMSNAAECFLRQLIWREFARYSLWHFPDTASNCMNPKFMPRFWKKDRINLKKWQQGKTGVPIVDAGMHQLWETGIMHNRVRMLVASLLTKNMGIAWQEGARWFWDTLVDADLASNTMGWQWVAGCGVDAAPYFRIFNPETQAKKFDEDNQYIERWLTPEHQSTPIIDLAHSRSNALARYNELIKKIRH